MSVAISWANKMEYRVSSSNTASSISTPVRYYLKTNNIDIIVMFLVYKLFKILPIMPTLCSKFAYYVSIMLNALAYVLC